MSTIASPRDSSATPLSRRVSNQPLTPTGSNRGSLDVPRSAATSPGPSTPNATANGPQVSLAAPSQNKRANRAALREYYNIKKQQQQQQQQSAPILEVTQHSEVPASDLDATDFDAESYVQRALEGSSLEDLLRTYTRVLGEVRALDAEKKALVYDNYSKLISATETIRKMRANMDPLNPMASTLDPAIAQIYSQASSIRDALRESMPPPEPDDEEKKAEMARQKRARQLARELLDTPARLRKLVADGKMLEARRQWAVPRRLLVAWQEKGVGGKDVGECLAEGDAAVGKTTPATQTTAGPGPGSARSSKDESS